MRASMLSTDGCLIALRRSLVSAGLATLVACSGTSPSTPPPTETAATPVHHHHHHHHHHADGGVATMPTTGAADEGDGGAPAQGTGGGGVVIGEVATTNAPTGDGGAAPTSAATFGTPLENEATATSVTPRWIVENGNGRLVCEGNEQQSAAPCPQCPDAPTSAAIVRAFLPAEQPVLQCDPPANERGRLPLRATFNNAGVPVDFQFPGVHVSRHVALCMGRALCATHMPTFQTPAATVDYEYVVMLPDTTQ